MCGVAGLLDGVSEIDWSALEHAYGSADEVPGWLAAMTDPETCVDALGDLDAAVYHQGGAVYSAGAAVVPFLIRFALDPTVPHRVDILDLVCSFAMLHHEMRQPWRSQPSARTCRKGLLGAFDSLLRLLDDPDPAIRRGGVEILVGLVERADDLADELIRRLPGEADPDVAADYILALASAAARDALTPGKRAATAGWLSDRIPPAGDPRRLTFLVAARRLGHQAGTAENLLAAYPHSVPKRTVGWLSRELGDDREARIALARIAIGEATRAPDDRPLAEVGTVMRKWRSATVALTPDIGAALDGPPPIRAAAVHLLAVSGDAGRVWSDRVAELLSQPGRTGALAAWALARWGDRRAVPAVERSLRRDPEVFRMGSTHYGDDFYWLDQDPGIADVCLSLAAYADDLVPAIRWRLRNDPGTATAYQLTEVLKAYGPAAAAAVPELTAMLDTQLPVPACNVLAELGPAAAAARTTLTRMAVGDGPEASAAAWTLFRVTGDPEPFLARDDVRDARRINAAAARRLGDLGPLAARYLPDIERQLVEQPADWPTWDGVELGFAHYRITSDPTLCLNVFDAALDPLRHSQQLPVSRQALRYLVALGPAATTFTPLLHRAAEQDERLLYSGGWRGISEDDEARDLARQALAAAAI
ncbi:hypothetical protein C1I93_00180 [Micromonospora endophytica]|uniref:Uncharacterized protein n=2 Tax=Micromonospora endophytica TaxID=515350 RepID=A0A2W2CTJ4_9ACTN|nr:hypothetical protein C1I93_00180 [Micromonospora endophytica]RIW42135.1 hypothetical protein D3H59_24060 [Micromonospora endophytica]BCJ61837.1 hypothetical protein Jiend_52590 [Micromonospora endophytica]